MWLLFGVGVVVALIAITKKPVVSPIGTVVPPPPSIPIPKSFPGVPRPSTGVALGIIEEHVMGPNQPDIGMLVWLDRVGEIVGYWSVANRPGMNLPLAKDVKIRYVAQAPDSDTIVPWQGR